MSFHSKLIAAKAEIAICALGVVLNIMLACNLFLPHAWAGRNDFLGIYAGARLAGSDNLYDRESVTREHLNAIGETGDIPYVRLPVYALVLKPLGWMRYGAAYAVWEVVSVAALLGFLILWPSPRPFTKWFIGCWSLPAFIALFNGQDDLFLLLWMALSARLLRAGKPFAAGIVLALCVASKYHLFLMVPLALLAQRRWRMFAGAVVSGGCLLTASFAVAGRHWPFDLFALLTDSRINPGLDHMPNLHSLLAGAPFSLPLQIAASLLLAAGVYLAARKSLSFESALGLALGAGLLAGYHGYVHDGALFLPALIAFSGAAAAYARIPAILLITPIPWCILHLTKPFPVLAQLLLLTCVVGAIAWLASSPQFSKADKIAVS